MKLSSVISAIGLALAIGCAIGCGGGTTGTAQGAAQNSAASSGGSSIGTSSGAASSGASTGSSTTGGSSTDTSTTGASTTTGGTGSAGRPPDFVDGGYVFCSEQVAMDAGSGVAEWMCPPGTYFCQSPGSCAQCLSDIDCANPELPTYEPARSRCDLDSGVTGYQNFCQRCTRDADCAGNGLATLCDLNPGDAVPSIDAIGFETCADLGPGCRAGTQPAIGGCASTSCTTDSDCADAVSNLGSVTLNGYSAQEAEPFCVKGQCTVSPDDNELCPNCYCVSDSSCRDPKAVCDVLDDHCACIDSSQCGGAWPICEIPQGADVDDAGQPLGSCGCKSDADCGDAGLKCLVLSADNVLYGGPACLFACTDPRFPGCANLSPTTPLCAVDSGLCMSCENDQQCRTQATGSFVGPFCRDDGVCGCQVDGDCPDHEVCGDAVSQLGGGLLGQCIAPPLLRCTPESCSSSSSFCDLDSGGCVRLAGARVCASNADCVYISTGAFCETDAGACLQCLADADCVATGYAAGGYSHCLAGSCSAVCAEDQDCAGNPGGAKCVPSGPSSAPFCGCAADPDCAGNPGGARCNAGVCGCNDTTDCPPGLACLQIGTTMSCSSFCLADAECPANWFCSETDVCRPRCDDGGAGCQAPALACDSNDIVGGNGIGTSGPEPGAVWCYECVTGDDCPAGRSCSGTVCNAIECYGKDSCHTGEVCGNDDQCHASCDAGACPSGQVCDTENTAGNGPDLCYQCLSAADCPGGEGCNRASHLCGTCRGPTSFWSLSDCPPDAICSTYWGGSHDALFAPGVCLQNCDVFDCPNPSDTCAVLPGLTPDHKYCFGCLEDSDCADAGAGARCDNSLGLTFTCQLPTAP